MWCVSFVFALAQCFVPAQLLKEERVGGVVCLVEKHELGRGFAVSQNDWEGNGVKFHWMPTPGEAVVQIALLTSLTFCADYNCSPTQEQLDEAVDFIKQFDGTNKSVYVHCKAGRSRSALVAACYLIQVGGAPSRFCL